MKLSGILKMVNKGGKLSAIIVKKYDLDCEECIHFSNSWYHDEMNPYCESDCECNGHCEFYPKDGSNWCLWHKNIDVDE